MQKGDFNIIFCCTFYNFRKKTQHNTLYINTLNILSVEFNKPVPIRQILHNTHIPEPSLAEDLGGLLSESLIDLHNAIAPFLEQSDSPFRHGAIKDERVLV